MRAPHALHHFMQSTLPNDGEDPQPLSRSRCVQPPRQLGRPAPRLRAPARELGLRPSSLPGRVAPAQGLASSDIEQQEACANGSDSRGGTPPTGYHYGMKLLLTTLAFACASSTQDDKEIDLLIHSLGD